MRRVFLVAAFVCLGATVAGAQNQLSAPWECTKPDPQHRLDVGDRPNHAFVVSQFKCTATKPWELEGVAAKEGTGTQFDEVSGNSSRFHGYFADTLANGDTAVYRYHGTATLKQGVMESAEDKWTLVVAAGKLKGVKGQGACKGKGKPDGSVTFECAGEYQRRK